MTCSLHFLVWISGYLPFLTLACFPLLTKATSGDKISITESNLRRNHTPGELIFSDDFDELDLEIWRHENTLGGANIEFQAYTNNRSISYAHDGILFIKPILTSDVFGVGYLYNGVWDLRSSFPIDMCTDESNSGCWKTGGWPHILNPVLSAKLKTVNSFYFKYGRVEVRAKLPSGDWMWPMIGMFPRFNAYGPEWPRSGDFRIVESRGNQLYIERGTGKNLGSERFSSSLHYGTFWGNDKWPTAWAEKFTPPGKGFDREFHIYGVTWTDEMIEFTLDGKPIRTIVPPKDGGFWKYGGFANDAPCPWRHSSNKMAPFDQKFYLGMNVAVGGLWSFPDNADNKRGVKPWWNTSPNSYLDFFNARNVWTPTWEGEDAALQIDYVKVYAI